ncbi:hypothetical protein HMPREF1425_01388 [Helicobacter pylori GAM71Ai]|nr:hypothetical protein HMPREF1425_01388 [Helicobacter pylori GAM71Ai]
MRFCCFSMDWTTLNRFILVIFLHCFQHQLILMLALVVRGLKGVSAFFQTIHLPILCPLILALLNHFR